MHHTQSNPDALLVFGGSINGYEKSTDTLIETDGQTFTNRSITLNEPMQQMHALLMPIGTILC